MFARLSNLIQKKKKKKRKEIENKTPSLIQATRSVAADNFHADLTHVANLISRGDSSNEKNPVNDSRRHGMCTGWSPATLREGRRVMKTSRGFAIRAASRRVEEYQPSSKPRTEDGEWNGNGKLRAAG